MIVSRFQIEQSHRNATDGPNSGLAKSTSIGIYKGAESGWFGRGKGHNSSSTSSSMGQTIGSSSSWHLRGHNAYPVTHRVACNLDENWKSSCHAQFEDLRISDSRQGFKSFERGRTATTNFQSYGNGLVADRSGYGWRQSSGGQGRSMASTSYHARQHYLPTSPSPSMQGQGWRQSSCSAQGTSPGSTSHHPWRHDQSMQGQGWRQSSGSAQGTSASSTSHHAWQHNLARPHASAMQGQGWRQVVQGHAWQHNASPPTTPSMQGYGWRQSGGGLRGMSSQQAWQNNPSPPSAPSMQAHGRGRFPSSAAPRDWEVRDTP